MFRDSQIDSASMDVQRKEQTKKKLLKDLIAIQSEDEEGFYKVLEGLMGNVAARMVPNTLEIVRNQTPAAPALSEEPRTQFVILGYFGSALALRIHWILNFIIVFVVCQNLGGRFRDESINRAR
jgi:hypothetical protein